MQRRLIITTDQAYNTAMRKLDEACEALGQVEQDDPRVKRLSNEVRDIQGNLVTYYASFVASREIAR